MAHYSRCEHHVKEQWERSYYKLEICFWYYLQEEVTERHVEGK